MPRSAGTYSAPASSWNPAVSGASATLGDWNALLADISNALTQSLSLDGQSVPTANLPMGGFKLTGLGAGSATGNSLRWEQLFSQGTEASIASAATTDIGAQNTNFLQVTGTTTITSFGANYNGPRYLRFAGALTLTHNATTLILPGAANITTATGDTCTVVPISGGWYVTDYTPASTSFAQSLSTSGYRKFTGGLIVQWGSTTMSSAGVATTFPIAFPSGAFHVSVTHLGTSPISVGGVSYTATASAATLYSAGTGPFAATYFAIGF